jgi:MoaA/NifB/PqqE/SkfB family radical SAM enzyme
LSGGDQAFEGGGMIKVDDFKSVLDKYADQIQMVWLSGGEPLAHPRFDQLANIVKSKGLDLKTSTNGVFIERRIDILKDFDFINISMDGFDHKSFEKYRGGTPAEFDKIVYGLSLLRDHNVPFSNSFILSQENLHEANLMLEFAETTKPTLVVFHNINPHGSKDFTPLVASNEKVQQMLRDITSRNDYPYDIELPVIFETNSKGFIEQKCIQQWFYASFNDKGSVSYCCHMNHDASIGNMFQGYDFNSDKMVAFRRRMMNHEYPKDDCLFCQRRFMGKEYGRFSASQGKWVLHGFAGSGVKTLEIGPSAF